MKTLTSRVAIGIAVVTLSLAGCATAVTGSAVMPGAAAPAVSGGLPDLPTSDGASAGLSSMAMPTAPSGSLPTGGASGGSSAMEGCMAAVDMIRSITQLMQKVPAGTLTQADVDEAFPQDKLDIMPPKMGAAMTEIRDLLNGMVGKQQAEVLGGLQTLVEKLRSLTSLAQEECSG